MPSDATRTIVASIITHIDLCGMTHLRVLSLYFYMTLPFAADIPFVLDQITSPEIERIHFICDGMRVTTMRIRDDVWTVIPAILRRPNFTQLRKLHFHFEGSRHMEVGAWIRRQLSKVESHGLIKLVVTEEGGFDLKELSTRYILPCVDAR
jgi:hypothetical protein